MCSCVNAHCERHTLIKDLGRESTTAISIFRNRYFYLQRDMQKPPISFIKRSLLIAIYTMVDNIYLCKSINIGEHLKSSLVCPLLLIVIFKGEDLRSPPLLIETTTLDAGLY